MTPEQKQAELERARQVFHDVLNVLPLSEAARRSLLAAAGSWVKAASLAGGAHAD